MMTGVIGSLGEALTPLPAGPPPPGLMAGASFRSSRDVNTLPDQASAWELFIERLKELSAYIGFIQSDESLSAVQRILVGVRRSARQSEAASLADTPFFQLKSAVS